MPDVCLCFQLHLPERLLPCEAIRARGGIEVFDDAHAAARLDRLADRCFLPTNERFLRCIDESGGRFRVALSISGTAIAQLRRHRPDLLESFRVLVASGGVELLAEPWHHSLAFLHSNREFERQVELHVDAIGDLFHLRPRVFRNTESLYNDAIAAKAETMGFDGVMAAAGACRCGRRVPHVLHRAPETARIKTMLAEPCRLAAGDENAFPKQPGERLAASDGDVVVMMTDYATLTEDGAGRFWESWENAGLQWVTPSEAVDLYQAKGTCECSELTSTDGRGVEPWTGETPQREALARICSLEKRVLAAGDPELLDVWARLQSSDHFSRMSGAGHGGPESATDPDDACARWLAALEAVEARLGCG